MQRYVDMEINVHVFVLLIVSSYLLRKNWRSATPMAMNTGSAQIWFLCIIFIKKDSGNLAAMCSKGSTRRAWDIALYCKVRKCSKDDGCV